MTITLKPTKAAKRAVKHLRGATLTIQATQGTATAGVKVKLK